MYGSNNNTPLQTVVTDNMGNPMLLTDGVNYYTYDNMGNLIIAPPNYVSQFVMDNQQQQQMSMPNSGMGNQAMYPSQTRANPMNSYNMRARAEQPNTMRGIGITGLGGLREQACENDIPNGAYNSYKHRINERQERRNDYYNLTPSDVVETRVNDDVEIKTNKTIINFNPTKPKDIYKPEHGSAFVALYDEERQKLEVVLNHEKRTFKFIYVDID